MKMYLFRQRINDLDDRYQAISDSFLSFVWQLNTLDNQMRVDAMDMYSGRYAWKPESVEQAYERNLKCFITDDSSRRMPQLTQFEKMLQEQIRLLADLIDEHREFCYQVDKRGFGIFKYGNMKQAINERVSAAMLRELRNNLQGAVDSFSQVNISSWDSVKPVFTWLDEYKRHGYEPRIRMRNNETIFTI